MKERPLIVSTGLIPKILEGSKTMTRRRMNPQPLDVITGEDCWVAKFQDDPPRGKMIRCRYGQVGDRLWVRETYSTYPLHYKATGYELQGGEGHWHSPIFMPRVFSRITLEIVSLRAERLQEITEEDAKAEGVSLIEGTRQPIQWNERGECTLGEEKRITYQDCFAGLWDSLNPKHPWESNPWCWCIGFRMLA